MKVLPLRFIFVFRFVVFTIFYHIYGPLQCSNYGALVLFGPLVLCRTSSGGGASIAPLVHSGLVRRYTTFYLGWKSWFAVFTATLEFKILAKKQVDLYSAFIAVPHTQGYQVRITQFNLQITPYLPLRRKRSPDGAFPDWGCGHLIAAYYSFIYPERMKGWVGLVGWPTAADGLPT